MPKLSELHRYVKTHSKVTEKWEEIGYALGLADEDDGEALDKIREDRRGDPGLCFNDTMRMWQRCCKSNIAVSSQQCTWLSLLTAIKSIHELKGLGAEIETEILISKCSYKSVICKNTTSN